MREAVTEQLPIGTFILHQVSEFALQERKKGAHLGYVMMDVRDKNLLVYRTTASARVTDRVREAGVNLLWEAYRTRATVYMESMGEHDRLEHSVVIRLRDGRYSEVNAAGKLQQALQTTWDYAQQIREDATATAKSPEVVDPDEKWAQVWESVVNQRG